MMLLCTMVSVVEFDQRIKESLLTQLQFRLLSNYSRPVLLLYMDTFCICVHQNRLCEFLSLSYLLRLSALHYVAFLRFLETC
jgi:hypothetical protein